MKKQFNFLFTLLILFTLTINAQDYKEEVLITIDGKEITAGEFERIYKKNNNENISQNQTIEEYLDMFINFKLKVREAENLGMDTAQSFLKEFNSYRDQLAKPYLADSEAVDRFAREAYNRMKKEIHASHIMVRIDERADPADTLYAYEKSMEIRQKLLDGEDFETLARATSDDPSAKNNGGDLGWFSVFRMVLPFEDAAYNTPAGEISMPVRTQYGYHIIKVHEVRNARGSVKTAHIYIRVPESMGEKESMDAQNRVQAIYDSLQNGSNWEQLVRTHSDDRSTIEKGGELPWFTSGQMIKEFEDAAYKLQNPGDIHKPVKSFYGWHIIKLLDKKNIGSFEEEKPAIVPQFNNGPRGYLRQEAFVAQLKEEYDYKFLKEGLEGFYKYIDSTVFNASWTADKVPANKRNEVLFSINGTKGTYGEFADFIEKDKGSMAPISMRTWTNEKFKRYEAQALIDFEDTQLERKYPEFKKILQEYHDGILLFDLTDKVVWSQAVKDSAGLEKFYNQNKQDYLWEKRADAYIIVVNDSSLLEDARKLTMKNAKKKKFNQKFLIKKLCPSDTAECVVLTRSKYEKGDDVNVDATGWNKGIGDVYNENGKPAFVFINSVVDPEVKKLNETRGIVTADYQKYLEDKWIEELKSKYVVDVNRDLLKKIKN